MSNTYAFKDVREFKRAMRAVRTVEGMTRQGADLPTGPSLVSRDVEVAIISGPSEDGLFLARFTRPPHYSDEFTSESDQNKLLTIRQHSKELCWVAGPNQEPLMPGSHYEGRVLGFLPDGHAGVMAYADRDFAVQILGSANERGLRPGRFMVWMHTTTIEPTSDDTPTTTTSPSNDDTTTTTTTTTTTSTTTTEGPCPLFGAFHETQDCWVMIRDDDGGGVEENLIVNGRIVGFEPDNSEDPTIGYPVVLVSYLCDDVTTTTSTTTTESPCPGECEWFFDLFALQWVLSDSSCDEGCFCLAPRWCPTPDDAENSPCLNTFTKCGHLDEDQTPLDCSGPASGTSTTISPECTTTTLGPDDEGCTGCNWYCVPILGCSLIEGFCGNCSPCPRPESLWNGVDCEYIHTECTHIVVNPPGCGGGMKYVCVFGIEGIPDHWEIPPSGGGGCTGGCLACRNPDPDNPPICDWDPPNPADCNACAKAVVQPCYCKNCDNPCPNTTPAPSDCNGECLYYSDGEDGWNRQRFCPNCDCAQPDRASEDTCDTILTACIPTTTTTTTSTTSTTTTESPPCGQCCWKSTGDGLWIPDSRDGHPAQQCMDGCSCEDPYETDGDPPLGTPSRVCNRCRGTPVPCSGCSGYAHKQDDESDIYIVDSVDWDTCEDEGCESACPVEEGSSLPVEFFLFEPPPFNSGGGGVWSSPWMADCGETTTTTVAPCDGCSGVYAGGIWHVTENTCVEGSVCGPCPIEEGQSGAPAGSGRWGEDCGDPPCIHLICGGHFGGGDVFIVDNDQCLESCPCPRQTGDPGPGGTFWVEPCGNYGPDYPCGYCVYIQDEGRTEWSLAVDTCGGGCACATDPEDILAICGNPLDSDQCNPPCTPTTTTTEAPPEPCDTHLNCIYHWNGEAFELIDDTCPTGDGCGCGDSLYTPPSFPPGYTGSVPPEPEDLDESDNVATPCQDVL